MVYRVSLAAAFSHVRPGWGWGIRPTAVNSRQKTSAKTRFYRVLMGKYFQAVLYKWELQLWSSGEYQRVLLLQRAWNMLRSPRRDLVKEDLQDAQELNCITEHPVCLEKWSLQLAGGKYRTRNKQGYKKKTGSEERFLNPEWSLLILSFVVIAPILHGYSFYLYRTVIILR